MNKFLVFALGLGLAQAVNALPMTDSFQLRGEQAMGELVADDACGFGHMFVYASEATVHSSEPGAPVGVSEVWVDYFRVNYCEGYEEWGYGWADSANLDVDGQLKNAHLETSLELWVDRWVWGPPPPPPVDGWTCPTEWYGDGWCDCGCGAQDIDCPVPVELDACQYINCDVDPADPNQCLDEPPPGDPADAGPADEPFFDEPFPGEGEGEGEGEPPPPPPPADNFVWVDLDMTWTGIGETYRGMNMSTFSSRSSHYMSRSSGSYRDAEVSGVAVIDGVPFESSFGWGNLNKASGVSVFHVTHY